MIGESDVNVGSAAIISAAVVFPIVVVIAGCAFCLRLCRGNEDEVEERRPLLTGSQEQSRSTVVRVENEQVQYQHQEPERHSPHSHSVLTGEPPGQNEERIEEAIQQEGQAVVVEEPLISDLLGIDEQEPEKSHQAEPDILEPRPLPDEERVQSSNQDQEQFLKTTTLEENDTIQIETNSESASFQTAKAGDELLPNDTPQNVNEPILAEKQDAAESNDPDNQSAAFHVEQTQHSSADLSSGSVSALLDKAEESLERLEQHTIHQEHEEVRPLQSEEVKETPDEVPTETGGSVKEQSEQMTEPPESKVIINFEVTPSFVQTIRTKAAKKDSNAIFGLTTLNGELFIISEHSEDVEVYDSKSLAFKHQLHLDYLFDPIDIKSCPRNNCLYIFDWARGPGEVISTQIFDWEKGAGEIIRFGSDGKLITKWEPGDGGGYISVTSEGNVILSVWKKCLLKEFTSEGEFLCEIQLPSSIKELRLATKLPNGDFVLCHGEDEKREHRVCLVDDKGIVVKSIGGKKGSSDGEFYGPNYMVVDGSGFILVADQNNRRVVLLSPDLEFNREVIQERDGLRYPVRMDLDRTNGRLFIADNDYLEDHTGWRDGRVTVFDFIIHQLIP